MVWSSRPATFGIMPAARDVSEAFIIWLPRIWPELLPIQLPTRSAIYWRASPQFTRASEIDGGVRHATYEL